MPVKNLSNKDGSFLIIRSFILATFCFLILSFFILIKIQFIKYSSKNGSQKSLPINFFQFPDYFNLSLFCFKICSMDYNQRINESYVNKNYQTRTHLDYKIKKRLCKK
jgi:hypothetical protein